MFFVYELLLCATVTSVYEPDVMGVFTLSASLNVWLFLLSFSTLTYDVCAGTLNCRSHIKRETVPSCDFTMFPCDCLALSFSPIFGFVTLPEYVTVSLVAVSSPADRFFPDFLLAVTFIFNVSVSPVVSFTTFT